MKYLESSAKISPDGLYRYWLSRRIGMGERVILFVGLNPSTADANRDDPTIRRCAGFAKQWGFDWLFVGNLHAYRSTDPRNLSKVDCPIGPDNFDTLKWLTHKAEIVVAAWGRHKLRVDAKLMGDWILSLPNVRCLGAWPKHPLYLPSSTELQVPVIRVEHTEATNG